MVVVVYYKGGKFGSCCAVLGEDKGSRTLESEVKGEVKGEETKRPKTNEGRRQVQDKDTR